MLLEKDKGASYRHPVLLHIFSYNVMVGVYLCVSIKNGT